MNNLIKKALHIFRRNDEGFSLVEILAVVSVMSVGMLSSAKMQTTSLTATNQSQRSTEGITVAQDKSENLMGLSFDDGALNDTTPVGTSTIYEETNPPAGYGIRWKVDADNPVEGAKLVQVTTYWTGNDGKTDTRTLSFVKSNCTGCGTQSSGSGTFTEIGTNSTNSTSYLSDEETGNDDDTEENNDDNGDDNSEDGNTVATVEEDEENENEDEENENEDEENDNEGEENNDEENNENENDTENEDESDNEGEDDNEHDGESDNEGEDDNEHDGESDNEGEDDNEHDGESDNEGDDNDHEGDDNDHEDDDNDHEDNNDHEDDNDE